MIYKRLLIIIFFCISVQSMAQQAAFFSADDVDVASRLKASSLGLASGLSVPSLLISERVMPADFNDEMWNCDSTRYNIIMRSFTYLGVSYRYGQSSEKGFDCSGFVKYIYQGFGIDLPHSSYGQYMMCRKVKQEEARAGDLVFFITRGSGISHVGIYLGENQFIHSPGRGDRVSVDTLNAGYYKSHMAGFGSLL